MDITSNTKLMQERACAMWEWQTKYHVFRSWRRLVEQKKRQQELATLALQLQWEKRYEMCSVSMFCNYNIRVSLPLVENKVKAYYSIDYILIILTAVWKWLLFIITTHWLLRYSLPGNNGYMDVKRHGQESERDNISTTKWLLF